MTPDPRDRHPTTCESKNHDHRDCWGYVRTCPCCGTRVCYADGAADDADRALPGVCDTCADLIVFPALDEAQHV